MAIESPKYKVEKKDGKIEFRQYQGYIQAEVEVSGTDYRSAAEQGFDILAGYIFGGNTVSRKIEMTSPVKTARSEKIPMTSPVKVSKSGNYRVAFIMPSKYTLENLPVPNDDRIKILKVQPERVAAIRFSGFFNQKKIDKNIGLIKDYLEKKNIDYNSEAVIAGYSPPWIPGFLAKNEVMLKIV